MFGATSSLSRVRHGHGPVLVAEHDVGLKSVVVDLQLNSPWAVRMRLTPTETISSLTALFK